LAFFAAFFFAGFFAAFFFAAMCYLLERFTTTTDKTNAD
jgi:hypothetical protein